MDLAGTWNLQIKGELLDTRQHATVPILKCSSIIGYKTTIGLATLFGAKR